MDQCQKTGKSHNMLGMLAVAAAAGDGAVPHWQLPGRPDSLTAFLAHHLGRALQLTNILRDLDEDAAVGRLYLPAEALREAGIEASDPTAVLAHPGLARVCAPAIGNSSPFELAKGARAEYAANHELERALAVEARPRMLLDRYVA